MTEKLKNLLHERAETADFAMPDVDAMTRDGDRTIRRRRGLLGATTVAAVAVLGVVAATTLTGGSNDPGRKQTSLANDQGTPAPLTWTTGSVLHEGGSTRDLGHPVDAFVRTAAGYVFASEGDVYETTTTGVQRIGQIDRRHPHLVSDPEGTLAGWVQRGTSQYVVQDLADDVTSVEESTTSAGTAAIFYALDGATTYWTEGDTVVAHDLETGQDTVVDARSATDMATSRVMSARNGTIAFYDGGVKVGPTLADAVELPGQFGSSGVLSPDATYYAPDAENLAVLDVSTGRDVTPRLSGYYFSTAYEWLNQDTLAVTALASSESDPVTLLSCTISTSECTVVAEAAGTYPDIQLPSGQRLGD